MNIFLIYTDMKKFSKIAEGLENKKFYKIQVELIVAAENEGEAAYISDIILSNDKYEHKYNINNISESVKVSETKNKL
jgi:hypothetical protein